MGHGRPRTAIGTFGGFTFVSAPNGKVKARVRYRDGEPFAALRHTVISTVIMGSPARRLNNPISR